MTRETLLKLFNKEKTRVTSQIINPIINSLSDKTYSDFFDYYIIFRMNNLIKKGNLPLTPVTLVDKKYASNGFEENALYKIVYDAVLEDFFDIGNFDIFKLVFGFAEDEWKPWALSFLKYIVFEYYESKKLTNIKDLLSTEKLDESKYTSEEDFWVIINSVYKTIFGYNKTLIDKYGYWEKTTKIPKKYFNSFEDIVFDTNPAIYILNSLLYFNKNFKSKTLKYEPKHEFRSFEAFKQTKITNKDFAYDYIINYFTAIILTQKIQISLWKAIQNLTFGVKTSSGVGQMKTITGISLALKSVWKLDDSSFVFFRNLKYQSAFNLPLPNTFDLYLNQDPNELNEQVKPLLDKFNGLKKILV